MKYTVLGGTGLRVSRICLGTMNLGVRQDSSKDFEIINRAVDMGINFFDTAGVYSQGKSEEILGAALRGKRKNFIIATKCWGINPGAAEPNNRGSSRVNIIRSVEDSLKRMRTDYVDLLIMHRPDETSPELARNPVPTEEIVRTMTDLVGQGKIRYGGSSCYQAWKLAETQLLSRYAGYDKLCSDQMKYNILDRFVERQILPVCKKYNIGVNIFSPLEYGWLSGKYGRDKPPPSGSRGAKNELVELKGPGAGRFFDIIEELTPIAEEIGASLSQFSLAWLLHRPVVTSVICGPRLTEHLEDNVKALDVRLSREIMEKVDAIAPPGSGDNPNYKNYYL